MTQRRRGRGEGTIYKTADGRWRVQISIPGSQRAGKSFTTRREAGKWLALAQSALQEHYLSPDANITLAEYLDGWLADIVQHRVRPKTYQSYEYICRKHLKPALGDKRLIDLAAADVQRLCSDKLACGLSKRTVEYIHAILVRALRNAVRSGVLVRNVASMASPPRPGRPQVTTLSAEQIKHFLVITRQHVLYPLYVLAVMTGMRQGELLGLRWGDVDLESGCVHVRMTMQEVQGGPTPGEPKTAGSRRRLVLPTLAVEALHERKQRQVDDRARAGQFWSESDLVFTSRTGRPLLGTTVTHRFIRALEKAGLPRIRFYDLRHTTATLLLTRGTHPKIVQELLGHSRINLTLDTYSHVLPAMHSEAAETLQSLLE